jgi:hypothetical protein
MDRALKTLRAVQWSLLASIALYGVGGEFIAPGAGAVDPSLSYIFTTLGVAIVGAIFVVRRTLVLRAAETLATQPEDSLGLQQWRTGFLATYGLSEALALFGLALRFLGESLQQVLPYYIAGFVLIAFFRPRQPAKR